MTFFYIFKRLDILVFWELFKDFLWNNCLWWHIRMWIFVNKVYVWTDCYKCVNCRECFLLPSPLFMFIVLTEWLRQCSLFNIIWNLSSIELWIDFDVNLEHIIEISKKFCAKLKKNYRLIINLLKKRNKVKFNNNINNIMLCIVLIIFKPVYSNLVRLTKCCQS